MGVLQLNYLKINEILDKIDEEFGYNFLGKDNDDHLISRKTWNKYVTEFFNEKIDQNVDMTIYNDKIIGERRHTKYHKSFVKEVIDNKHEQLVKQYNSNRKTMIDTKTIQMFEKFASVLNVEVDNKIYNKRIPITKFKKMQEEDIEITKEDIKKGKEFLFDIIIDQLIDIEKIKYDIKDHILNNNLHYGYVHPLKLIENEDGSKAGFEIDAKNYLKESVKKEIAREREIK